MNATEKPKRSRTGSPFCYIVPRRGDRFVGSFIRIFLPLLGAGILLLAVTGCGRKGPLDLPPSAAINQPPGTATEETSAIGPDGRPVAPAGTRRALPIDWLLK
jgi:predicted small lipoprotein YifL